MAKVTLSDRERYAIYAIVNPMTHQDRAARRAFDRLWEALKLDEIGDRLRLLAPTTAAFLTFDNEAHVDYEVTSEQRDMLIEKVCGVQGLSTMFGRMLNRPEAEMLKGRDGPS